MAVIAIESTDLLSAQHTGAFLLAVLTRFFGKIDPVSFAFWHAHLRKTGHFAAYGLLSYLMFRAWRATLPGVSGTVWNFRWAFNAVMMTTLVASLDEWHQTFIPSRTGTVSDVLLDMTGAMAVQILIFLLVRVRRAQELA